METDREGRVKMDTNGILPQHWHNQSREGLETQEIQREGYNVTLPKVQLPSFNEENPRGWIRKYRKLLKLNFIPV
jgi:hypothetical protein